MAYNEDDFKFKPLSPEELEAIDKDFKPLKPINEPKDSMQKKAIGGQTHIEEAKKHAEQSRMDDYHMEQTEKAIAGVSPQDYDLAQSQPMKTGSYKEGGNIHVHKGHDYIKDLL